MTAGKRLRREVDGRVEPYQETVYWRRSRRNIERQSGVYSVANESKAMTKFLLWLLLLIFCWPLALAALVLYPIVWLFLLPFRIVGIAVDGVLQMLKALILFPARALRGTRAV